jgi:transposase
LRVPQNFIACDREQELLLPPSLREWLPEGHLAWFVIDVVDGLDLAPFLAGYRQDGWGRAAHDPAMMVALIVYAYAIGERSSRRIERRCREDVAFRVITANQAPDHATIARFRVRHERALGELFGQVLGLCADAGLVRVGVVAVDGTKVQANACERATRDYEQIAREILEQAAEIDALEDEQFGERRGDELPPAVATREGRQRWLRDAQRRLEQRRAEQGRPIPRSRAKRLLEARRRLEEELEVERRANAEYEAYRARGVMKNGRRFGSPPKPYRPPERPAGKINLTDLDSRNVKTLRGWVQGYNAQAVCTENQIVIAAEVIISSADFGQLEPMVQATEGELAAAGVTDAPEIVLADAGFWHTEQIERLTGRGLAVLIAPDAGKRKGPRPGWNGGLYAFMRRVLATDHGGELYRRRNVMIEPVFGHTKFNRRIERFQRRGRAAARSEWRLITATHNLLKLHTHTLAAHAA